MSDSTDPIDLRRREFPEARPPHLPDVITGPSGWVLLFALAALVQVALALQPQLAGGRPGAPPDFIGALIARVGPIASTLFGAALFVRHPDARRTLPLLVFGVGLFAVDAMIGAIDDGLVRFLEGALPIGRGDLPLSPAAIALSVFTSLVATFAVLYTGAGLAAARRSAATSAFRPLVVWLSVLAILNVVISTASVIGPDLASPAAFLILNVIGVVLNLISALAWTYLLAVAIDGWLAEERPRLGWGLAAVGAGLHLGVALGIGLVSVFTTLGPSSGSIFGAFALGSALAWLLLLLAFALGLPSTGSVEAATPDPPAGTTPGSAAG